MIGLWGSSLLPAHMEPFACVFIVKDIDMVEARSGGAGTCTMITCGAAIPQCCAASGWKRKATGEHHKMHMVGGW